MFRKILVPVDIAHESSWINALPQAVELAEINGGAVTVVTVIRDISLMFEGAYLNFQLELLLTKALQKLQEIVSAYHASIVTFDSEVRFGSIRREILAKAQEIAADLIVMTSHRPEMTDYLIGPNAAHIAHHAGCSVLIVRAGEVARKAAE